MNKLKEKTNLKQQRKGISLIVLVITIIVMGVPYYHMKECCNM